MIHALKSCLLYTSYAADDLLCLDLGGRRFFFKQKTAYDIMPSLVGSEMCIRDRSLPGFSIFSFVSSLLKISYDTCFKILSLIHILRCRRSTLFRSWWSSFFFQAEDGIRYHA